MFANLNRSGHNYLRITRVIKCLGEVGLEHLVGPWMDFMINEVFVEETLSNCKDSCANYWVPVLRNDAERERLLAKIPDMSPPPQEPENRGEPELR
jgi:hypothetical protein